MAVLELAVDQQFQSMLISEALKDLGDLWSVIPDPTNGKLVRDVLEEYFPTLVQTYGQVIAVQSAERFEKVRNLSNVNGRYTALLASAPETDRINSHARRLIQPIFQGLDSDPDMALRNLESLTTRLVQEQGRRTTVENTFAKGSKSQGFVRVPGGVDSCSFCIMLSSKTFTTKDNARAGTRFHNVCRCSVQAVFEGVELEGYDQEAQYQKYLDLRK